MRIPTTTLRIDVRCLRTSPKDHAFEIDCQFSWVRKSKTQGSFLLSPPRTDWTPHTIMDMRNNRRCTVLTHAQVNFSQSEASSLLRGGRGVKILVSTGGGGGGELTEKIQVQFYLPAPDKYIRAKPGHAYHRAAWGRSILRCQIHWFQNWPATKFSDSRELKFILGLVISKLIRVLFKKIALFSILRHQLANNKFESIK